MLCSGTCTAWLVHAYIKNDITLQVASYAWMIMHPVVTAYWLAETKLMQAEKHYTEKNYNTDE